MDKLPPLRHHAKHPTIFAQSAAPQQQQQQVKNHSHQKTQQNFSKYLLHENGNSHGHKLNLSKHHTQIQNHQAQMNAEAAKQQQLNRFTPEYQQSAKLKFTPATPMQKDQNKPKTEKAHKNADGNAVNTVNFNPAINVFNDKSLYTIRESDSNETNLKNQSRNGSNSLKKKPSHKRHLTTYLSYNAMPKTQIKVKKGSKAAVDQMNQSYGKKRDSTTAARKLKMVNSQPSINQIKSNNPITNEYGIECQSGIQNQSDK